MENLLSFKQLIFEFPKSEIPFVCNDFKGFTRCFPSFVLSRITSECSVSSDSIVFVIGQKLLLLYVFLALFNDFN